MHALHEVVSKLAFIDDTSPKDAAGGGEDAVQLMTLHKAKGLEFSVVILVGLDNSGLFRGDAAAAELDVVDQATNLVYVGVTRTENLLVVSAVERDPLPHWQKFGRGGYGRGGGGPRAEPSRMLQAMYDEFDVEVPQVRAHASPAWHASLPRSRATSYTSLACADFPGLCYEARRACAGLELREEEAPSARGPPGGRGQAAAGRMTVCCAHRWCVGHARTRAAGSRG